ncbi:SDR family oxidoreductase [Curvibacter sp. HBC61]|uniref:SDR family oxidoreductase n=1 Tax=Curvibacter cyanobacteriorum TaxID=3026422 RepID=A0ABT5N143_9BURK|nr:SDR family oxidoreductase [Curvibacter sp. HBC61]MDD0839855.1 SDR family oxidoreductase [Curvibacter sp. HBC61]
MTYLPTLLITGGTGFVGGALAARLIQTPRWDDCLFLVRAPHREDGLARIAHVLRRHHVSEELLDRLHLEQIICGDLNNVDDWKDDPRIASIEKVLSSAAIASFGNHPSIWPTNVDGVLAMAHALHQRCRLKRFLHIGTAMACGRRAPLPVPEGYDAGEDTEHFLEYTASKHEVERRLRQELPDLPLVVARPSIVVGHTHHGCEPSGSIYWVFRIARALQTFPCELDQKIDVIPVDYCAEALELLLEKPQLQHTEYHLSAGEENSCSFEEIDAAIAQAVGQPPMRSVYKKQSLEEIAKTQDRFKALLGPCNRRIVLRAIRTYGGFASMGMLFQNQRLLDEGMRPPQRLATYAGHCERTSRGHLIAEQMKFDYK